MVSQNAFLDWVSKKEDVRLVTEVLSELESYCEHRGLFKINLLDSTDPVALCFMESIAGSNEYEAKYPQSQAFKVLSLYKEYLDEKSYLRNAKWWKKEVVKCYKSGLCLLFWKEDEDWIDSEPKKFFYKSKAITVSSWKALYNNICNSLYNDYPEIFSGIAGKSFLPDCAPDIVSKKDIKLLKKLGKVGGSLYLELGLSTKKIVERIFALLNLCHVSPLDLPILYVSNLKDKTSYVADNVAVEKENNVVTVLKEESVAVTDIEAEPSLKQQNASHVISTSAEKAKNDVKELRLFGLESGEAPSSVQPVMFSLQDSSNIDVKDWKDMYLKFARQVCSVYPEIKKNMMEHAFAVSSSIGFIDNKLDDNFFLVTDISEEEILRRIKVILIKFVGIPCSDLWIWCSRASKSQVLISSNLQKTSGPCELEVDFCSERDMDRTLPISCEFSGKEVKQFTNWNQLYLYVIKTLHSWKPPILKEYVGKSLVGESSPDITDSGSKSGNALFISDNLYLEINQRITGKIKRIHALLDLYEVAYSTLTIKYSDIPFTQGDKRKKNNIAQDVITENLSDYDKYHIGLSSGKTEAHNIPSRSKEGLFMTGKFITELSKLRKLSSESVDNTDKFDSFKKYMHVERQVEIELKALLRKVNAEKGKCLILLCGSAGDGKSHLISYLHNADSEKLLEGYSLYNDATESSAPKLTSIDTLAEKLSDFNDDNYQVDDGKKMILAINLGTLNNFIDSDKGKAKYSALAGYVRSNGILDDKQSVSGYSDGVFQHVSFSDYQLFALTKDGIDTSFLENLFKKVFQRTTDNPFYKAYLKDSNRVTAKGCPVRDNYEFLCNPKNQKAVIDRIVEIVIKDKAMVSTRDVLNLIYDILVHPEYKSEEKGLLTNTSTLEGLKNYIKYTTPMLLNELKGSSHIHDYIQSHDILRQRSSEFDDNAIQFHVREDINDIFTEAIKETPYYHTLKAAHIDLAMLAKENSDLKSEIYRFIVRLKDLQEGHNSGSQNHYEEFIRFLYMQNAGTPLNQQMKKLYESTKKAVLGWNGDFGKDWICIDDTYDDYWLLEDIELDYVIPDKPKRNEGEILRFTTELKVGLREKHSKSADKAIIDIDFALYELIADIADGYSPTVQDKNIFANFASYVQRVSDFGDKANHVILKQKNTDEDRYFELEYDAFGYKFGGRQ